MELYFQCPEKHAGFLSSRWSTDGGLEARIDRHGRKYLHGLVRVFCPLCGKEHAYKPSALACPVSVAGREPADSSTNKGGA